MFTKLEYIQPHCLAKIFTGDNSPKNVANWEFTNEIKPVDLYCYLYAKYGSPNGLLNIFRNDDSDNLIHWEWTLACESGLVSIQGHNFRTEVHLSGDFNTSYPSSTDFIDQIKSNFKNYGPAMSKVRAKLEKWTRFVNPYHRINSVINNDLQKLNELNVNINKDRKLVRLTEENLKNFETTWNEIKTKYDSAIGLTYGLRSMLPVLAESFINLVIFILSKPEIKENQRLFQNTIRQQIDIRIQSMHLNCTGFTKPIDYTDKCCKEFHTLMNDRNDLLHGNVEISKLTIGDVFFNDKVPIFSRYDDFWGKTMGISLKSVKFSEINRDHDTVVTFINYVLTHLEKDVRRQIELIMGKSELGYNLKNGRLGCLFSEHIADFRLSKKEA